MTTISDAFESVYRDFVTVGVPASGKYDPPKPDIRALGALIEQAAKLGVPLAATLPDSNIEIVCGTVQRDPDDPTKWNYIDNEAHTPVGVSGTNATASGYTLTIPFAKTYSRVIGFVCGPDETFASGVGVVVGASVGLDSAILNCSIDTTLAGNAYYGSDGAWHVALGTSQGQLNGSGSGTFTNMTIASANADVTITHSYLPGADVSVSPYAPSTAIVPKIPVLVSATNTSIRIRLIDVPTNTFDVSADTTWSFWFRKNWHGAVVLDGTETGGTWPLGAGNIWFFGIFEV